MAWDALASVGALTRRCFMRDSSPSVPPDMTSTDSWPRPGRARNRRETRATRCAVCAPAVFVAGCNLLVGPRTMSDGSFEQSTIFELVSQNRFEEVQVRNRFGVFQSSTNYSKRRKLVSKSDELPA